MTGYDKIKRFVSEVHEINCALTDEIIEFIDEVILQEQVANVAKPDDCAQLYEVAPKTEIRDHDTLHRYYMCPNSKCFGGFKAIKRDFEYCPYCGIKLSWRNFA